MKLFIRVLLNDHSLRFSQKDWMVLIFNTYSLFLRSLIFSKMRLQIRLRNNQTMNEKKHQGIILIQNLIFPI